MDMKRVQDSCTEQIHFLRYQHLNGQRRLFGGTLMQWIDELAGIVATRHAGGNVITAAVDSLIFKEAAYLNELIHMRGCVTYTGRTSMEVRVDTCAEDLSGNRRVINQAFLAMVAIDDEGTPIPVPGILLETEEQRQEWQMGEKRYNLRKTRRKENF